MLVSVTRINRFLLKDIIVSSFLYFQFNFLFLYRYKTAFRCNLVIISAMKLVLTGRLLSINNNNSA